MSATPLNKVYRYRRIDAITIELLCHDTLYFADPTQFNDPLDCIPTVISDCESTPKRDPTSDRRQLLDTLKEFLFRVGS
jgi:hypothetical protein